MQVVHVDGIFGDAPADFVGLANCLAAFDAPAGEPHAERIRMMVSPRYRLEIDSVLSQRCAAEFTAPYDKCFIEQPATFEIFQ